MSIILLLFPNHFLYNVFLEDIWSKNKEFVYYALWIAFFETVLFLLFYHYTHLEMTFFSLFFFFFFFNIAVVFVIRWHESAMDIHVFPIPIPPPTSLSTRSLWVFPVHQEMKVINYFSVYSLIFSNSHLLIKHLLHATHWSSHWGYNSEQQMPPSLRELVRETFEQVMERRHRS